MKVKKFSFYPSILASKYSNYEMTEIKCKMAILFLLHLFVCLFGGCVCVCTNATRMKLRSGLDESAFIY